MGTGIVLGQTMDTGIVLHRWTLTMNTMTLSSTGQLPLGLLMIANSIYLSFPGVYPLR